MKKLFVLALIGMFMFAASPAYVMAAAAGSGDACAAAQADVTNDTNKMLWIGAGCLLNWVGIILGYVLNPTVPAARLMGKSSDYVMNYTSCYQEKGKQEQGGQAIIGCVISGVAYLAYMIYYFVVVAAAVNSIATVY